MQSSQQQQMRLAKSSAASEIAHRLATAPANHKEPLLSSAEQQRRVVANHTRSPSRHDIKTTNLDDYVDGAEAAVGAGAAAADQSENLPQRLTRWARVLAPGLHSSSSPSSSKQPTATSASSGNVRHSASSGFSSDAHSYRGDDAFLQQNGEPLLTSSKQQQQQYSSNDKKIYSDTFGLKQRTDSQVSLRIGINDDDQKSAVGCCARTTRLLTRMAVRTAIACAILATIFYWPLEPVYESRHAPYRPRPKYSGTLARNSLLDERTEKLFAGELHGPESFAWTSDKRAFFTGVEGGFIVMVEPYVQPAPRYVVVAHLNSRNATIDETHHDSSSSGNNNNTEPKFVPFCERDTQMYGAQAEMSPRVVEYSRCSRPLGIRLSPDDSYLYVSDPMSGLYRVELQSGKARAPLGKVFKLVDFSAYQDELGARRARGDKLEPLAGTKQHPAGAVMFADDIAVDWGGAADARGDLVYMTDASRVLNARTLIRLMVAYDDTGRVLVYDSSKRELRQFVDGPTMPVQLHWRQPIAQSKQRTHAHQLYDKRNLSFPNGLELTPDKSALLISDLNNRRIIKHYLRGERAGASELVLWSPGYADNLRRGRDDPASGEATYWAANGCAVEDSETYEIAEFIDAYPRTKDFLLKLVHILGRILEVLGERVFHWTYLQDAGAMLRAIWLRHDPQCGHGLVYQFTESGRVLRALHSLHRMSDWRSLSEASERVNPNTGKAELFLGSVYYSYIGRTQLD